jgi:D-alanyl-D-alanine carboxypeptidase (penicillin-binding protein 5/6)
MRMIRPAGTSAYSHLWLNVARVAATVKLVRFFTARMIPRHIFRALVAFIALAGAVRSSHAAQAYIILDDKTGYVFEGQNARDKRQVGSLTKVATACVVLDWAEHRGGNLNQVVSIPPAAFVGITENNIGFAPGDQITLRDLMYAALVQSDNIAAFTLAAHVGNTLGAAAPPAGNGKAGPVELFVTQMNALAKQLKMERTRFSNPHGIDDNVKPMPYSTAEDMARLTRYAMNKAAFRFYVSQHERQISFQHMGKMRGYLLRNSNELVGSRGIDGVKTGQTARAGQCLILSARRESEVVQQGQYTSVYPRHIIIVLLGSGNRFGEGEGLLNRGWQLYDQWAAGGRVVDQQKML